MKFVFTGGGSAGHVTPNIAIMNEIRKLQEDYSFDYIGSEAGIEKNIIGAIEDINYHSIRTGKLRRYFSLKNFTDPFKVLLGYKDAVNTLRKIKPDVVFSKGGFVSVPVVYAARKLKIPVIAHESDMTPGLANKLSKKCADKICVTFPETLTHLPENLGVLTGSPIRAELLCGNSVKARNMLHFDSKPVILVMGGSLGSVAINKAIRENLATLTEKYNIIHLCGKNNLDEAASKQSNQVFLSYKQFEFITDELPDFLALADFVISRAGANAIHEFLALHKPMILIPLPAGSSRGDQILNSESFKSRGFALVLKEEDVTPDTLKSAISQLVERKTDMIQAMKSDTSALGAAEKIAKMLIEKATV